jgi:hypothetical protein
VLWPGALALALTALVLARTVRHLDRDPALNWDMLPAMALAVEWTEEDPVEVHRRTYEAARAELPPEVFADLSAGVAVRAARYRDPQAFHEHLAFFRSRVLYTLAVRGLHALGTPLTRATWWVPLGAFALGAALFVLWCARYLPLALACVLALGLAHTPALLNQANTSTADGLATLLVLGGAYALLERRSFALGAVLLALAIGARPDSVILVGCLAAAAFLLYPRDERPSLRVLAAWVLASAGLYLGLARFAGEYGWWPLITISFEGKAVHPAALPTDVDWGEYGEILARQVDALPGDGYLKTPAGEFTGSTLVFLYAALAVLALVPALRARAAHGREAAVLAALLATYLVRFLLFPQLWDRFLAPFYALVPLCLLAMIVREQRSRGTPS